MIRERKTCRIKNEPTVNESIPYLILAALKEPHSIFTQDISYREKKKNSRITIGLYNILLLILILLVFILILFSGGITIGQMAPPPIFIGNIYGLPIKAEFFTVTSDGSFFASLKLPVYNKSILSGRLSIRNIHLAPVSTNFICTPNKYNNNFFFHSIITQNSSNGFIFPLNPKFPTENEKIITAKTVTLITEDSELRQLEFALGRYGEAESKLGTWLPPGKNEFIMAVRGIVDFNKASEALIESFGSKCINGIMRHFVVHIKLDFSMRYFLGSITSVKQDIGYILFPACNL